MNHIFQLMKFRTTLVLFFSLLQLFCGDAYGQAIQWAKDGLSYFRLEDGAINRYTLPANTRTLFVSKVQLTPAGAGAPLKPDGYTVLEEGRKVLLFTNAQRVWRYKTRGDYWLLDLATRSLKKLGRTRPAASLMFAKISPDGRKAAYVSNQNLYIEDLATGAIRPLTTGGNRKLINGTFDWAYEEEFFCRDGFRWSPDSRQLAYWQIDARQVKDYLMINHTDSIYPVATPVEYPVAGEPPSPARIGVVDIATARTRWMKIPYDSTWGAYIPRMEWAANNQQLILQHLNRKQNESRLMICDVASGKAQTIYSEQDPAWIDIMPLWDFDYQYGGWDWLAGGKDFIWASEKDGWRHLYRLSRDGKKEILLTQGAYDVLDVSTIDEKGGYLYFLASPDNATQKYLYRAPLDGRGTAERLSPENQPGTHRYQVSPLGSYALHTFTNHYTPPVTEWVSLPDHRSLEGDKVNAALAAPRKEGSYPEFFTIRTAEGVEMDGWMVRPANFDSTRKYPVLFYVYTEPWGQEVRDQYGIAQHALYRGSLAGDGYFYIAIDNRGTPVPKGRAWRKSVYQKIGQLNIRDQALAARELLKRPYLDTARVAVWGWSGGGSATLNLLFQYPEIYKTGISVAAVGNQLTYDNIYQERYMGLPQESREAFVQGSPITYARNLRGNLLYIHGTGDDNVHFNNAEMLVNELIRHNKQFQFMPYPNRAHGLSEGEGTFEHLSTLYTNFLRQHCPPGGR